MAAYPAIDFGVVQAFDALRKRYCASLLYQSTVAIIRISNLVKDQFWGYLLKAIVALGIGSMVHVLKKLHTPLCSFFAV